jgi:hypothetical protein
MPSFRLPPLILHPFSDHGAPATLVEGSRANLMLEGIIPRGENNVDELERRLLISRYCEIKMLYYLGKDLRRWIEQCLEMTERDPALAARGFRETTFASLLVDGAPVEVQNKLRTWGVHEFRNIFSRALGIHAIFMDLPPQRLLSSEFLRYYYRFADEMYSSWQKLFQQRPAEPAEFDFDLYASGEYTKMLEQEWGAQ